MQRKPGKWLLAAGATGAALVTLLIVVAEPNGKWPLAVMGSIPFLTIARIGWKKMRESQDDDR